MTEEQFKVLKSGLDIIFYVLVVIGNASILTCGAAWKIATSS